MEHSDKHIHVRSPIGHSSDSTSINIAKLFSSRVVIQILMVFTAPVVTRLFSPEDFGVLQLFNSTVILFAAIVCLKYELSIPLGDSQQEASGSFILSFFFTCLFTLGSLGGVILGREYFARRFNTPTLADFLWLLPAIVFLTGLSNSLNYWASREGNFGVIAWSGIGDSFSNRSLAIMFGYLINASAIGLFIGRFAGAIVNVLFLFIFLKQKLLTDIRQARLTLPILRMIAIRHKKFPLFNTWERLLLSLSVQLPPFIFGLYYCPAVVGYYSLAHRILMLPILMLGQAIAKVFFPAAAHEYRQKETLSPIVKIFFTRLVQISIFPMAALGLFGAMLFRIVFGQEWAEAGVYAQIMAGWYFLIFLSQPLDVFALVNRQDIALILTIITLLGRAACLLVGVIFGSPRFAVTLFVSFSVLFALVRIFLKFRLSSVSSIWALREAFKYLMLTGIILLPVKGIEWMIGESKIMLGILCLAGLIYLAILVIMEPSLKQFLKENLHSIRKKTGRTPLS